MEALNILAKNVSQAEISIVACVVGMVFFMKYNHGERSNKANRMIGYCLGAGFLMLVAFRIYKGVFW